MTHELFDTEPRWDLSALYPAMDSPQIKADLDRASGWAIDFNKAYLGRLEALVSGDDGPARLGGALKDYNDLDELLNRLWSYADLLHACAVDNPQINKFYGETREAITVISSGTLFFPLELNELCDALLNSCWSDPVVAEYRPWIEAGRASKPWQLSTDLERLLHDKATTGRQAWNRLFDQLMVSLRFDVGNSQLTSEETFALLSDTRPEIRAEAAQGLAKTFAEHAPTFAHITNTLARDKAIETEWRGQPDMATGRHLSNQVEAEVVEALTSAVKSAYADTAHRYYALKAKWLGMDALNSWDRNAPLPGADDQKIHWNDAKEIVLTAFGGFEPKMADIASRFFDENWIDAPAGAGKSGGASSHPTVPSAHPYVLVNYLGKPRDVATLAHELGHGVHQVLAADRGHLLSETPLTLAETASVFGEMLTFQSLLERAPDPASRKRLIAGKVEDMLNTVVRQIAFYDFERRIHGARLKGELTPDEIGAIWLDVQRESLGPSVLMNEGYETFWCYIPHFLHTPFYVYAYAFGECLVNSLYAVYQKDPDGFQEKYLTMLAAGGTLRHKELLAPFGLDASDPDFWAQGLGVISSFIDQLEAMED
jgi:oligoendopeptidase F